MKYTLEKVRNDGSTVPVRESEVKEGGSVWDEFETTSKSRASDGAHHVKNRMGSEFAGVTIFAEDE